MHLIPREEIVIVGAARTPIGGLDGVLKGFSAPKLGGAAIAAALDRAGVEPGAVDEVIMGQVVTAGVGQGPAKQAAVAAGVPQDVPATQVNSVCSSGMMSVFYGVQAILTGTAGVVVAGGMESRSNAPYLLGPRTKAGKRVPGSLAGEVYALRTPDGEETLEAYKTLFGQIADAGVIEANIHDGLFCPFESGLAMIDYAMTYAKSKGFTPADVDEAARESYRAAADAWEAGLFNAEVVPVGDVRADELTPRSRWEALCGRSTSVCSPYNTPPLADAGAALVLMSRRRAEALGVKPLARIMGIARRDCRPADFMRAPIDAVMELERALDDAGQASDFPLMQMNESFGLQRLVYAEVWPGRLLNVRGGSVALKHPLGAAGARLMTTLVHTMRQEEIPRGIAGICFGGGGAMAAALERTK